MGGWDEEVWYSLYQIACLEERRGAPPGIVSGAYLDAFAVRARRAEPLVALARFLRNRGQFSLAHVYAAHAAKIPRPSDLLFVEEDVYAWRAVDELTVSAFHAGFRDEGRAAMLRLWSEARFPASERERMRDNCRHYGIATAGSPGPGNGAGS